MKFPLFSQKNISVYDMWNGVHVVQAPPWLDSFTVSCTALMAGWSLRKSGNSHEHVHPQCIPTYPQFSTSEDPDSKVYGTDMGPTGPRWAPCLPHEPCYMGSAFGPGIHTANNTNQSHTHPTDSAIAARLGLCSSLSCDKTVHFHSTFYGH